MGILPAAPPALAGQTGLLRVDDLERDVDIHHVQSHHDALTVSRPAAVSAVSAVSACASLMAPKKDQNRRRRRRRRRKKGSMRAVSKLHGQNQHMHGASQRGREKGRKEKKKKEEEDRAPPKSSRHRRHRGSGHAWQGCPRAGLPRSRSRWKVRLLSALAAHLTCHDSLHRRTTILAKPPDTARQ